MCHRGLAVPCTAFPRDCPFAGPHAERPAAGPPVFVPKHWLQARMAMVEEEMSDFDDGDDDFYDEEEAGGAAEAGAGADPARAPSTRRSAPGTKRTNVVKEIYESELSYGTDLKLIIEQFLQPLAQKAEVFNSRVLEILFSNILEILTLHTTFVQALGSSIGRECGLCRSLSHRGRLLLALAGF